MKVHEHGPSGERHYSCSFVRQETIECDSDGISFVLDLCHPHPKLYVVRECDKKDKHNNVTVIL